MPTLTRKITPIGTLQTPQHRLNPIPLPQRPTLLPQTTQRPQTRTRTNPLRSTRLHSHHRQPPHTLPTPPQACQTPIKLIAYPQRTRPPTHPPITPQPLPHPTRLVRISTPQRSSHSPDRPTPPVAQHHPLPVRTHRLYLRPPTRPRLRGRVIPPVGAVHQHHGPLSRLRRLF